MTLRRPESEPGGQRAFWFQGWNVLGASFAAQAVVVGAATYGFSVFIVPLGEAFQASRFEVVLVPVAMQLATGALSPFLGRALDRGGIRAWMIGGTLLLAAGFALAALATALWQITALYASLIAVGTIVAGPVAATTVVAKWFVARRGRALGISAVGTSLGGMLLPPLIAACIEAFGWRSTYAALAVAPPLLIAPLVWLAVRDRPEDLGLVPDGVTGAAVAVAATDATAVALGWRSVLRNRGFWSITISFGIAFAAFGGALTNLVPFAVGRGYEADRAAYLLSILTACGVLGKLAVGASDRFHPHVVYAAALVFSALGVAGLTAASSYSTLGLMVAALGFGTGGLYPLLGVMIGRTFGRSSFGQIMGLMSPFTMALSLPAAPLAGWIFDRTGSYDPAFLAFAPCFGLAGLALLPMRSSEARGQRR